MSQVFNPSDITGAGVIAALPTKANAYPNDVYVANRVDALPGSGTQFDPFHVGNPTAMDTFAGTTLPALYPSGGAHVRFAAGTYLVNGDPQSFSTIGKGINWPGGNRYEGSGSNQTIFRLNAISDSGQNTVFVTSPTADGKNTWVHDITFDGNWQNIGGSPPVTSINNGLALYGTANLRVFNCRFINNYGSSANGQEMFVCKLASAQITGTYQPLVDAHVSYCYFGLNRGDYGGATVIWSFGASNSTVATYDCYAEYDHNFFDNWNNDLSGLTGQNIYCIGGVIGNVVDIHDNQARNPVKFFYAEGGLSYVIGHHNTSYGCRLQAYNLNTTTGNITSNFFFDDEIVQMATAPTNANTNNVNNGKAGFNGTGSGTVQNNFRIHHCTVNRLANGPKVLNRARTTNVAKVNFTSAQNFITGDIVDTSGFSGAGYNLSYVTLTKISSTQYTFPSTGGDEGTTADAGGTLDCATFGMVINNGGASNFNFEISNNRVDAGLYNLFIYTSAPNLTWVENLTPAGAPITLTPGSQSSLPNVVRFPAVNSATVNGNNLVAALAHAALINPNAAVPSATNRVIIQLDPAKYDLGSQTLAMATAFVDLVGTAQREQTYITSSATALTVGVQDYKLASLSINTSSASASVYAVDRSASPSSANETWEDVVLNGAGTFNSIRNNSGTNQWSGTYRRIKFANGGFFADGQGTFAGLAEYIEIGTNGTTNFWMQAGSVLRYFVCLGQLNLFSQNGLIEYGKVITTASNTDAVLETSTAIGAGGIMRYVTLIANGTGTAFKNSGGARSTSILYCNSNADLDNSITNLIAPGQQFNTKDTTNIIA